MRSWMFGIVSGYALLGFLPGLPPVWLLALLFSLAACLWHCRFTGVWLCCGFCLGLLGGTWHGYAVLNTRLVAQCEAVPLWVEGEISSLPVQSQTTLGGRRQRFEFTPSKVAPSSCEGPARLLLSYYGDLSLHPGERWRFGVKLKKPWGLANPGSFNLQTWYAYSGIDGTGSVKKGRAILLKGASSRGLNYHLYRQDISMALQESNLQESTKGVLRALTVADKSGIDNRLWWLFQFYGINHLLVISGMHIGIIGGAGFIMGTVLGRMLYLVGAVRIAGMTPAVTALIFATVYAALAGFSLATVRALCMLACFVVASLFGRGSLSSDKLLFAAVFVMIVFPLSAIGSGFWLSFSAVACLLWLSQWRPDTKLHHRLLRTHVYMALAMIPLGGWWFSGVSMVAALANMAMIPLVGFYVVPVALLGVVARLSGIGDELFLWTIAAWPLEQLFPYAASIAQNQFLYSHFSPSLADVVLAIAALALLAVPLPPALKFLVLILALPIFLPQVKPAANQQVHSVLTVLDVGQGTAVVIRSGENTLVYDTGGGDPSGSNAANRVILPYLREKGVRELKTLIVSHGDSDHSTGTSTLLDAMPIEQLIVGGEMQSFAEGRRCRAGQAWRWPSGVKFQFLSPEVTDGLSSNNSSCVLQVHIGEYRILLSGDIDAKREKALVMYWRGNLRSHILLAAHHGSINSSSYPWLKTVQADVVAFSHGYLNQFGHPHEQIVARFGAMGGEALSTARLGALEITIDPAKGMKVESYRKDLHRYWM